MEKEFLERMLTIAQKGGDIALDLMQNSAPTLKSDRSVLTRADTAVSHLARESLKDLLQTKDHVLIDEEDTENSRLFDQSALEATPFVWAIDPIDGTIGYSNRMPSFAISIGVLKELKPWLGVVYFPWFKEMFYCDGEQSFFVKDAFTPKKETSRITQVEQSITSQSLFFGDDALIERFGWDFSLCSLVMSACAAIDLCWPAIGRGAGCFLNAHIWDFAGSWPVFLSAGLNLRSLSTGKTLDRIHVDLFQGKGSKTWKLREPYILCSETSFPLIQKTLLSGHFSSHKSKNSS